MENVLMEITKAPHATSLAIQIQIISAYAIWDTKVKIAANACLTGIAPMMDLILLTLLVIFPMSVFAQLLKKLKMSLDCAIMST